MSLEQQLHDAMVADVGVSAFIGDRFYHLRLPQQPIYPAGFYKRIDTVPLYVQTRGRTPLEGGQATVGRARVQMQFWADGASGSATCLSIFQAVMAAMENFNAWQLPQSPSVIISAPNRLLNFRIDAEPNTQPPLPYALLDYEIWYQDQ